MSETVTDEEIARLLSVPKDLPSNWQTRLALLDSRDRQGFRRRELRVKSSEGDDFEIKCRQSTLNPLDFSVILIWHRPGGQPFRLLRCNGPHPSQHTNRIEKEEGKKDACFADCCHVHRATARYQERSCKEDSFAEPTDAYHDYEGALRYMLQIAGFGDPEVDSEMPLFEDE
jgi:hypothetical protein